MSAKSIQFLTDEEYEAVRRDMATIIDGAEIETGDIFVGGHIVNREQIIAKLTAYVDQKIKRYY